jgi:hypothetical protein
MKRHHAYIVKWRDSCTTRGWNQIGGLTVQLRDYDALRHTSPRKGEVVEGVVLILPVIRLERLIAETVAPRRRRSLLGDAP